MHLPKLVISLLVFGFGSFQIYQATYFDHEPALAKVIESHKTSRSGSADRPGRTRYAFQYEYVFEGTTYISDRYTYAGWDKSEAVCKYKSGDSVIAYVDPRNPERALIKTELSGFVVALAVLGFLMLIQTGFGYFLESFPERASDPLREIERWMGAALGSMIFFGGIGYFIFILIYVGLSDCV